MANYSDLPIVKSYRRGFYDQSPEMMPYQFKKHFQNIPVYLPSGGKRNMGIQRYMSGFTNKNEPASLRTKIRDTYGADLDSSLQTWLGSKRLTACFSGHGLPEEISMLATYAVYSGYKSEGELDKWFPSVFGLDCNGFSNAYFTAIKTFKKPLIYIPSYTQHAGVAREANEITYDGVICFARHRMKTLKDVDKDGDGEDDRVETDDWQVRPNPGNGSHIMVIDCWAANGSSLWITQMSATYGLDTAIYEIVKAPTSLDKKRARWVIKRSTNNKRIDVMISLRMPEFLGKDGKE